MITASSETVTGLEHTRVQYTHSWGGEATKRSIKMLNLLGHVFDLSYGNIAPFPILTAHKNEQRFPSSILGSGDSESGSSITVLIFSRPPDGCQFNVGITGLQQRSNGLLGTLSCESTVYKSWSSQQPQVTCWNSHFPDNKRKLLDVRVTRQYLCLDLSDSKLMLFITLQWIN